MKIVIKIGSNLIANEKGINKKFLKRKAKEIAELNKKNQVILVTSGAIACGMQIARLKEKPKETLELQLLSGEGQTKLIEMYRKLFSKTRIAQVLVTSHNFETENEKESLTKIIKEYQKRKIIPIINENDLVSKEEISSNGHFPDNDILAAIIAERTDADTLILLTSVDGIYDNTGKIISKINNPQFVKNLGNIKTTSGGRGGIQSKLKAGQIALKKNVQTIIANGKYSLKDILTSKVNRTVITR